MSIVNNVRDAFSRVIEAGAGAGYLIRDFLFGAPETVPLEPEPYTPPFQGGQCEGVNYSINISWFDVPSNARVTFNGAFGVVGAISSVITYNSPDDPDGDAASSGIKVIGSQGAGVFKINGQFARDFQLEDIVGTPDNCGDLPNPNPPLPIADSGLADSIPPDIAGDGITISEGLAPLPAAGALAAALAALRAAQDALALADALADALKALDDLLKNKDDKDDKKNVKVIQLDLGLISRDGFLRLYPSNESAKYQALYLDLQMRDIPRFFGRFFGNLSPNYYRFTELGYIAWVSPTFGVINVDSIRFGRVSLGCPDGAIGFFYHLGLNGVIKANATAFYEEELQDESE